MHLRSFLSALFISSLIGCPANVDPEPEGTDGATEGSSEVDSGSTNGESVTMPGGLDLTTDGSTEGNTDGTADGAADGTSSDAGSSDGSSDGTTVSDAGSDGSSDGAGDCDTLQIQVKGLFEAGTYDGRTGSVGNCISCHTDPASGYSASYTDMRASYELSEKVNSDDMPMSGDSWSADDKLILRNWIICGRPW